MPVFARACVCVCVCTCVDEYNIKSLFKKDLLYSFVIQLYSDDFMACKQVILFNKSLKH